MNGTQTTSVIATLVGFAAGILSQKLPIFDLATWTAIVGGLVSAIVAAVGYMTRDKAIVNQVGNMPGVTVVAPPAIANSLPENSSVMSSTEVTVKPQ